MQVGIIIGTVISTRKDEELVGYKLLITQPVDLDQNPVGTTFVAVDTVGAGVGELVMYVTGSVAPFAVRKHEAPVDAAIIGIIDSMEFRKLKEV